MCFLGNFRNWSLYVAPIPQFFLVVYWFVKPKYLLISYLEEYTLNVNGYQSFQDKFQLINISFKEKTLKILSFNLYSFLPESVLASILN